MLRETIGRFPRAYRLINRIRGYRLHGIKIDVPHSILGTTYGAWPLPTGMLTVNSIVYTFGIGEDISYDLELIESVGCEIHAFDPTPIAQNWLARQTLPKQFIFHNLGLSDMDGDVQFFSPEDAHSFSIAPSPERNEVASVTCPVRTLHAIMSNLGHDHIDLLKMDIEGFEYPVIADLLKGNIRPKILNIEFHHKAYGITAQQTKDAVVKLQNAGYAIYWVSDLGREYGLIIDH